MRAGNTATPTMLDFSLRFPRCTKELLKKVTDIPFNYFTNPSATYYLQPSMKDVTVKFSELAMLPKPLKGCLAQKQLAELRQWASINGRSVRQNTTRNFSTKDKPGTLPLNVYQTSPPKERAVNSSTLLIIIIIIIIIITIFIPLKINRHILSYIYTNNRKVKNYI